MLPAARTKAASERTASELRRVLRARTPPRAGLDCEGRDRDLVAMVEQRACNICLVRSLPEVGPDEALSPDLAVPQARGLDVLLELHDVDVRHVPALGVLESLCHGCCVLNAADHGCAGLLRGARSGDVGPEHVDDEHDEAGQHVVDHVQKEAAGAVVLRHVPQHLRAAVRDPEQAGVAVLGTRRQVTVHGHGPHDEHYHDVDGQPLQEDLGLPPVQGRPLHDQQRRHAADPQPQADAHHAVDVFVEGGA
mmetsp:Transcript_19359/g.58236  ORF Transcript_19359/g.58236 Transcript_19359/m.58236 type:complete len:250 (+) Transcript_19359:396-1145(+)